MKEKQTTPPLAVNLPGEENFTKKKNRHKRIRVVAELLLLAIMAAIIINLFFTLKTYVPYASADADGEDHCFYRHFVFRAWIAWAITSTLIRKGSVAPPSGGAASTGLCHDQPARYSGLLSTGKKSAAACPLPHV